MKQLVAVTRRDDGYSVYLSPMVISMVAPNEAGGAFIYFTDADPSLVRLEVEEPAKVVDARVTAALGGGA